MATGLTQDTVPQLSHFGPARDDVLSTLAYFFGAPVAPEKLKDYSEHHAATYHFPDAFLGTNVKLRDTINNLVLRSPQVWQTSIGLPFLQINNTTVEWDEIHFDVRMLQRVPYEGVSRMTTSLKRQRRDRVVRRGLGMMIESDFYATEAGRQHFNNTLTSIRYCIQETCNFDVLFSYLTTSNYDFRYDLRKALRPTAAAKMALRHELMMYGICQKEGLGMDKAIEEVKFRMSRYGVKPNMMVIPPQLALYMALGPEEKTLYATGGPKADAQFESGVEGFVTRAFRGLAVVTADPFEITDESEAVQMLTRTTQVGEHYFMSSPEPNTPVWHGSPDGPTTTGFCDIVIYCEEGDRLVRMKWVDALKAVCYHCLSEGAEPINLDNGNGTDGTTLESWYQQAVVWAWANEHGIERLASYKSETELSKLIKEASDVVTAQQKIVTTAASPTQKELAQATLNKASKELAGYMATKVSSTDLPAVVTKWAKEQNLIKDNKPTIDEPVLKKTATGEPVHIVLARPFIEHRMHSAIVTVAGADTGRTLFGPADMQLAANVQVKVVEGHYTGHFKSVITKPENVYVARDVCCAGYSAGANTHFFAEGRDDKGNKVYTAGEAVRNLVARLGAQARELASLRSVLAFPMSNRQRNSGDVDQVISVTTRLLPWETTPATSDPQHKSFPGGNAFYKHAKKKFGLTAIHYGEDLRAAQHQEFISQGSMNNALCFLGPHRVFNPYSKRVMQLVPGQGHFGPDAVPGDARWRRGESVSLKSARESMKDDPLVPPES